MRWMLTEIGRIVRTLFLALLISAAAGVALLLGADVYLEAKYFASPLVRQFEYANRKNVDGLAILTRFVPAADLHEYRLEQVLQEEHGFKCQPIYGVSRCLYRKRGLINCAHAIALDLTYSDGHTLKAAPAEVALGCDAF